MIFYCNVETLFMHYHIIFFIIFQISHYFEDIKVTTLDLGPKLPHILSVSTPWQDEYGLWVDLDIEYHSICQATVQTQGIRLPAKDEPDREAAELLR